MDKNKHKDKGPDEMIFKPDLDIRFENKSSLKRSEETGIPLEDEKAIAIIEGDAEMDKESFELSVLYTKAKLQPDLRITYPNHASLKKHVVIVPLAARYAAAAAILLLFSLGIWFIFSPEAATVRQQDDLARMESVSIEIISSSPMLIDMAYRNQEALQVSSPDRESYILEKINNTSSSHIIASPTLASANLVLYTRPSYTRETEPVTEDLALNEPREKSLTGKIFSGIFNKAKVSFEGNTPSSESESSEGFLWNLAELGMKGVNAMGDHDYTVVRDYNNKGNVKGLIVLEE